MATTIRMTERETGGDDFAEAAALMAQVEQAERARKAEMRRLMRVADQARGANARVRELLPDLFA